MVPAPPNRSREIIWRRVLDDLSFEHARLRWTGTGPVLTGSVLVAEQGAPLVLGYELVCDATWQTQTVAVEINWRGAPRTVRLERDPGGRWRRDGESAPDLDGCTDVDLEVTPATNALPINRLRIPVGGRREIVAAWVRVPSLHVLATPQAYERLAESRYRYTSLGSGFTAVVDVDQDGLPTEYEGLWRRIAEA
jgi:uncharacterized protein